MWYKSQLNLYLRVVNEPLCTLVQCRYQHCTQRIGDHGDVLALLYAADLLELEVSLWDGLTDFQVRTGTVT